MDSSQSIHLFSMKSKKTVPSFKHMHFIPPNKMKTELVESLEWKFDIPLLARLISHLGELQTDSFDSRSKWQAVEELLGPINRA